jgi:hypothetical protein
MSDFNPRVRYMNVGFIMFMPFVDYLNLWKTRALLNLFNYYQKPIVLISVALVDFVLWCIIFTVSAIMIGDFPPLRMDINEAYWVRASADIEAWSIMGLDPWVRIFYTYPFANYFWVGMVPGIWLWLNVFAVAITVALRKSRGILRYALFVLDIENHPVGFVAATAVAGVYGIAVSMYVLLSN